MKIFGLIFTLFALSCTNSIEYIDVKTLPLPDCTGQKTVWTSYSKNKPDLLVIPDIPSDSASFNKMFAYIRGSYNDSLIKTESELIDSDFDKAITVYGIIGDYKKWDRFETPIKQIDGGFIFDDKEYTDKEDGLFYISDNRMIYTSNSMSQIWKQQSTFATFYQFMIFENGLLSKLGISDTSHINIKKIRESNYNYKSTKYFNLYFDRKIGEMKITDSVVIDICSKLDLELPNFKINSFVHNDPNATRLFSNYYFMTGCDTLSADMKFGTVQIDGIHVTGIDMEFVKHESFHYLWGKLVGEHHGNEFLNEGIQEYYQQLLDSSRVYRNIEVLKRHPDFDIENLIVRGNSQDFWGGPSENNWPIAYNISGLYVKYLIDNWGLDIFKEFFPMTDRENSYRKIYGMTPKELKAGFYNWIETITPHNNGNRCTTT